MRFSTFSAIALVLACCLPPVAFSATNDQSVARQALRDELWDIARNHAAEASDVDGRILVLESYAREGKWDDLLAAFDSYGYPAGEYFAYYRALALFRKGECEASSNALHSVASFDPSFAGPVARLRAELAIAADDLKGAAAILAGAPGDDVDTELLFADVRYRLGEREQADALWRKVLANTNSTALARAKAAVGLRDVATLQAVMTNSASASVRNFVALRLGKLLLPDAASFAEGERMIRDAVRANPDQSGARSAFYAVAEARFSRREFESAAAGYADMAEIWPDISQEAEFHEGRGRTLSELGRDEDALANFLRAEELFKTAELRAHAAARAADLLVKCGRESEANIVYRRIVTKYHDTDTATRVQKILRLRAEEAHGRELYGQFRFAEARAVFEQLAKDDLSGVERFGYYCALCRFGEGDEEGAEKAVRRLVEGAADAVVRSQATRWLAKFDYNRGNLKEASLLFERYANAAVNAADAPQSLVWAARASLSSGDYPRVLSLVVSLLERYSKSVECAPGLVAQGEALQELGRFDEAAMVFGRAASVSGADRAIRRRAEILRADALFAMGADNPASNNSALAEYQRIRAGDLGPGERLEVDFKIARILEKLDRFEEALDHYYTYVVLAYRSGVAAGVRYGSTDSATFVRAAFRMVDGLVARGRVARAVHVLDLVETSGVQAADEARRRRNLLNEKGLIK